MIMRINKPFDKSVVNIEVFKIYERVGRNIMSRSDSLYRYETELIRCIIT